MEKISVIVPVYRAEAYLRECVQSLLSQTYPETEILLMDDGSPDCCAQLCDLFAAQDARILVFHGQNQGPSAARNAGIGAVSGSLLAFTDADDFPDSRFLSALAQALETRQADIAMCGFQRFADGQRPAAAEKLPQAGCLERSEALRLLTENTSQKALEAVIPCNKLYRRSLFEAVRFPLCRHEDEYVAHRLLGGAQKVATVDAPLYFYRQHGSSFMAGTDSFYSDLVHLTLLDALADRLEYLADRAPQLTDAALLHLMDQSQMFYHALDALPGRPYTDQQRQILRRFRQIYRGMFVRVGWKERLRCGCFALHPQIYRRLRRKRGQSIS